jgi:hypothetical protein
MDDFASNDVVLILSVDGSIEIHMKYDIGAYLKFVQNLMVIFLKLKTQGLNSNKIKT